MSDAITTFIEQLRDSLNDPDRARRVAEYQAKRTDPYVWYCRICGARGEDESWLVRNEQAVEHLRENPVCGGGRHEGRAEHGRLLHVWSYGR